MKRTTHLFWGPIYVSYIYINSCQCDSICICQIDFGFLKHNTALWRWTQHIVSDLGYPGSLIIILWWHLTLVGALPPNTWHTGNCGTIKEKSHGFLGGSKFWDIWNLKMEMPRVEIFPKRLPSTPSTPWKINIWNPKSWRWMENDVPFSNRWFLGPSP